MHPVFSLAFTVALLAAAAGARADEEAIKLKPGAGHDAVVQNCATCHSLDYVRMNSVFMTPQVWDAEVQKMIKAYGAPIEPADAKAITDYLATQYGVPPSPPAQPPSRE
jgi:sulfite dehydrogenase (cytochrome) subunit B